MNYPIGAVRYGLFHTSHPKSLQPQNADRVSITLIHNGVEFSPIGGVEIYNDIIGTYLYTYAIEGADLKPGGTIHEQITVSIDAKTSVVSTSYLIAPRQGLNISNANGSWGPMTAMLKPKPEPSEPQQPPLPPFKPGPYTSKPRMKDGIPQPPQDDWFNK